MTDQSHLDQRYFVDDHVYNCPFCKRRNVMYELTGGPMAFNWSETKTCYIYVVRCRSCEKRSMHLSYTHLKVVRSPRQTRALFSLPDDFDFAMLDQMFFYCKRSVITS